MMQAMLMRGLAAGFLLLAGSGAAAAQERLPDIFSDAEAVVPRLATEIRYVTDNNFVGRPIDGYEVARCLITRPAATALAAVQERLAPFGLGLKVFDCYRPARAVASFVRWAEDLDDVARKPDYYPDVAKEDLFEIGYIAERSGHSRGSTVDLTIIDQETGEEIDMGTGYDLFSPKSWPVNETMTAQQRANRLLLQEIMVTAGFAPYDQEWWHFTLGDEPFPDTYFDVPVSDTALADD